MLDFISRIWKELSRELNYFSLQLRHWWGSLGDGEQMFAFGIVTAALLLLALRRPVKTKTSHYNAENGMGLVKQFLFGAAVLIIFTFGIDIVITGWAKAV